MNEKGQSSFEMLLVAAIIIVLCTIVVGKYFSASDSTTAIAILKEKALEKISAATEFHLVKNISYIENADRTIDLTIDFEPDFPSAFTSQEITSIQNLIAGQPDSKTRYASAIIIVT